MAEDFTLTACLLCGKEVNPEEPGARRLGCQLDFGPLGYAECTALVHGGCHSSAFQPLSGISISGTDLEKLGWKPYAAPVADQGEAG